MKKISYNNMELKELEDFFVSIDEKKFRAEQLFVGLHNKNYFDLDEFTNISKELKLKLEDYGNINKSEIFKVFKSKLDKTRKYLIKLNDGNIIESVYMEYSSHNTICISSQVGCKMGCTFCASTKQKFVRNLEPSELLNQIYLIQKDVGKRISNIVLMGIGEPLDNYDNVIKFIRLISNKKGYNISIRNITLSTCGIVPKIYELADENLPINITISLHNPFDNERKQIMPIGNRYSIGDIIKATKYYFQKTGRRISFEYTLIEGENDSYIHAKELRRILRGLNCHVNLIPLNKIKEFNKNSSNKESINKFKSYLDDFGITTTIRTSLGQDIDGACGQLRAAHNFN
ncbi:23S rRNA (adenine(2503)-C(2))-methyltransferase RlmN [Miniphocaeibacter halophilus]|uniref:23S rRNA (Adenine(2503)-C(2))-methyltransferase RlmN n=1 Tax=Miniphocaeibacter halophilus TaxID=2931922 RepID=A0AC61MU52_9FIRM|nr:23S rRNA (adenine(2503)-C(2))-methyltransferase RlmN [Miniphocaeibacter halophilus]QQK07758.1 23S rRNA (adenine(2503)-C(2))-methyltransferase RlmN [Miniphocaeibacter halophilus]